MMENIALIGLAVLSTATIIGIFATKTPGFGRYTTSVLILALVLFLSAFFLILGKIESSSFANIVFAIAGYAGGLINGSPESKSS
jgi:hypothetical protein